MNRLDYLCGGAYGTVKRGSDLSWAKADEEMVRMIRRQYARKKRLIERLNQRYSAKALARQTGLHVRTVEKIIAYETWGHVK